MEYTTERIELALAPRPVRYVPTLESTNDVAAAWLHEGAPDGAVVVADEQTAGRGRFGRTWHTPPGVALALSVVLYPSLKETAQVNMAGTLAVLHTLRVMHIADVSIKWANDVMVSNQKISGVLPELIWDGDNLQGLVLGIGLNVRNDFDGTPLAGSATTVEACVGRVVDRVQLLAVLLYQLDRWLAMLGKPDLKTAYVQHMPMLGEQITVSGRDGDFSGTARAVQADGALVLEKENGEQIHVYAGDVTVKKSGS